MAFCVNFRYLVGVPGLLWVGWGCCGFVVWVGVCLRLVAVVWLGLCGLVEGVVGCGVRCCGFVAGWVLLIRCDVHARGLLGGPPLWLLRVVCFGLVVGLILVGGCVFAL